MTLDEGIRIVVQVNKCQRDARLMSGDSACVQEVWRTASQLTGKKNSHSSKKQFKGCATACFGCESLQWLDIVLHCKEWNLTCDKCKKRGHFAPISSSDIQAASLSSTREVSVPNSESQGPSSQATATMLHMTTARQSAIYVTLRVHGRDTNFLVDTESSVSIMSWDNFKQTCSETYPLQPASIALLYYSKHAYLHMRGG